MALSDIEWPILKSALIVFAASLCIAVFSVGLTEGERDKLQTLNDAKQREVTQARNQYYEAVRQRQLVDDYWPPYRKLEEMGFIGDENRLNWVDVLREVAERNRILAMNYEVQPRAPDTVEGITDLGDFNLQSSKMTLRMTGLHEGNVIALLKDLSHQKVGLFSLKSCVFERRNENIEISNSAANLASTCTLVWHSILTGAPPT